MSADSQILLLERVRRFALPEPRSQGRRFLLRQGGEIRMAPEKPWLAFHAEQWFDAAGLDFCWTARARMARIVPVTVVDAFQRGRGLLSVRIAGLIPVARMQGGETDRGEAMRALAELPWRPSGFSAPVPSLAWSAPAPETLRASFDDGRTRCSVDLEIDSEGRVLSAGAPDRARSVGSRLVLTPWRGVFSNYKLFGGVRIPTRAEVSWLAPEGPFAYFRSVVTDFRLDR